MSLPPASRRKPTLSSSSASAIIRTRSGRESKPTPKLSEIQETRATEITLKLQRAIDRNVADNADIEREIDSESLSVSRAEELKSYLLHNSQNLNRLYESFRLVIEAPDDEMRLSMDRLERDYTVLSQLINNKISPKPNSAVVVDKAVSIAEMSSVSKSTRSSTASKLAAKRVELEAKIQRDAVDAEVQRLKLELAQKELELAREKQAVDKKLLEELKTIEDGENGQQLSGSRLLMSSSLNNYQSVTRVSPEVHGDRRESVTVTKDTTAVVQALTQSMMSHNLLAQAPAVFKGNPLEFREWFETFEDLTRQLSEIQRLRLLKRYTEGQPNNAIRGCLEYASATHVLRKRFGKDTDIISAYRNKIHSWPKINTKDRNKLQEFVDMLSHCLSAIRSLPGLSIMNNYMENELMMKKLPDSMCTKWAAIIVETEDRQDRYPTFEEFVKFLQKQADIAHKLPERGESTAQLLMSSKEPLKKVKTFSTSTDKTSVKQTCVYCEKTNHQTSECFKLLRRPAAEKKRFILQQGLCFSCMETNHFSKDCKKPKKCKTCEENHPTALHVNTSTESNSLQRAEEPADAAPNQVSANTNKTNNDRAEGNVKRTSMTVPVWISHQTKPNTEILAYALLDTQSDTSFMSQSAAQQLDVTGKSVQMSLTTLAGTEKSQTKRLEGIQIRGYYSREVIPLPPIYTRPSIPTERSHIPTRENAEQWEHLNAIAQQLPELLNCPVGLLLGYDCPYVFAPQQTVTGTPNQPFAVKTAIGWSIVGGEPSDNRQTKLSASKRSLVKLCPEAVLQTLEADFTITKDKEEQSAVSQQDLKFLQQMETGITKRTDGFYEMPLPFRCRPESLPNNRSMALKRFHLLKTKFSKDDTYFEEYRKFMDNIISHKEAERVPDKDLESSDPCWYMPHFGVYHPKKKKLRVVFDGSAKFSGTSLNDLLLTGPDLMNSLAGILIRFRREEVAIAGDIERMFHQFRVKNEDTNFLRFIWLDDNGQEVDYRMTVHLFGAASSPGCTTYGLRKVAQDNSDISEEAARFICQDFYVDDGLTSVQDSEAAIQLIKDAVKVCERGNIRLHKFVSNDEKVLKAIPDSEKATSINLPLSNAEERVLGLQWNVCKDVFLYKGYTESSDVTRRSILSTTSKVFDPLGLVSPFILQGKIILQQLCADKVSWDEPVSDEMRMRWESWLRDLTQLHTVEVNRCTKPTNFGTVVKTELHSFSDASSLGYGACSYIRYVNDAGDTHCALVLAKARVAPLSATTIPRLELQAAVVAARLSHFIQREIQIPIDEHFFWSDSKIVLSYISNEVKRFHVFVANRIQTIHNLSQPQNWRYVPSDINPADMASRGMNLSEFQKSNWLDGPKFLHEPVMMPRTTDDLPDLDADDPEVKATIRATSSKLTDWTDKFSRYDNWSTLIKSIAILQECARTKSWKVGSITLQQKLTATEFILRKLQEKHFTTEIERLKNEQTVNRDSPTAALNPFLDNSHILRVGGRMGKSPQQKYEDKHPILIPKKDHLTSLLIRHYHNKVFHQGKSTTVCAIRNAGLHIISCGSNVSRIIRNCVSCQKLRGPASEQQMSHLPQERVEESPPFTHIGTDCFGPFPTRDGRKDKKIYVAIFVCLYSRAIHLETLEDLTTDSYINALRCLIAIRGNIRTIRSDQGTNIMGAKSELSQCLTESKQFLLQNNCEFVTNPAHASHFGGIWERQIRTIRNILNGMMLHASKRLSPATLRTVLYEAMAIANNRPIHAESIGDPQQIVVTPNSIVTMKTDTIEPIPGEFPPEELYGRKRWRQVQSLAHQFRRAWTATYLQDLQKRQKWQRKRPNMMVGDIVLDKSDQQARCDWRLGRVVSVETDIDGLVRRVKVRLGQKGTAGPVEVERPIQKLVKLF